MLETSIPETDVRSTRLRRALFPLAGFAAQGVVIFVLAYMLLGGRSRDMHVPIRFGIDSVAYLMQSKTTLEHGWWWSNPRLAAPFTLNNLLWPSNSTVDQLLIAIVGLVTREPSLTINVTWLLMLALSGVVSTYCMGLLGVSRASALVMGTLFALSPFAIYRNLEHFMMVAYLVPIAATLAVLVCAGTANELSRWQRWTLYSGCVLTGLNYAYYALFGAMFAGVAAVAGYLTERRWRVALPGLIGALAIAVATGVNALPSFRAWDAEGKPVIIQEKVPAEAEVYGLKIRHLVSPLWGHTVAPLAAWNRLDEWARFPLEGENRTARLGIIGAAGLMGCLGVVLAAARARETRHGRTALASGQMMIIGILFATIGGFGTLFNLFVASDIRAYNRIVPFLSFYALLVVALGCDVVLRRSRVGGGALLAALLLIGLWDQRYPFTGLNAEAPAVQADYRQHEALVREVEAGLPNESRVLQLPQMIYLNDVGQGRKVPYDSLKPYLVSQHLHWSYGALSNEQFRWQLAAMKVPDRDLPAVMAREGFSALWVDTYGYEDAGASMLATLTATPGAELRWSNERYRVIDIRRVALLDTQIQDVDEKSKPSTAGLTTCAAAPVVSVEYVGGKPGPFNTAMQVEAHRDLRVAGWIVPGDKSGLAVALDSALDGQFIHVYYGFPRSDVATYFGSPEYRDSGFVTIIPGELLTPGPHRLSFRAASKSGACAGETSPVTLAAQ